MSEGKVEASVQLRILVVAPPPGVVFAVQRGKAELLAPLAGLREAMTFELPLRLVKPLADGTPNFLGEYAQGTPTDRFVYLNSGTLAGHEGSAWTRRAKLKLAGIPADVFTAALAGGFIEARVQGTMKDGGPICASVKPHDVAWSHTPA